MKRNKKKSITIRITESQYKNMIDAVIEEEMNKSEFIRESIQRRLTYSTLIVVSLFLLHHPQMFRLPSKEKYWMQWLYFYSVVIF